MSAAFSASGTAARVPKLAVRNKVDGDAIEKTAVSTTTPSHHPASPPVADHQAGQRAGQHHGIPRRVPATLTKEKKPAKKGSGVLGFFSLKEPSTTAWEDYAKQQKKAATGKHGRDTPVGIAGVSTQKLPDHVPKVNSKWDGLPQGASKGKKTSESQSCRKFSADLLSMPRQTASSAWSRTSTSGESTSVKQHASLSSRPLPSTLRCSNHSSIKSSSTFGDSEESTPRASLALMSSDRAAEELRTQTPSPHPGMRARRLESAAVRNDVSAPPVIQNAQRGKNAPAHALPADPRSSPPLSLIPGQPPPVSELPTLVFDTFEDSSSYFTTSAEASPQTPPYDRRSLQLSVIDSRSSPDQLGSFWLSDADKNVNIAHSPDSQPAKPAVLNFSRPLNQPRSPSSENVPRLLATTDRPTLQSGWRDCSGNSHALPVSGASSRQRDPTTAPPAPASPKGSPGSYLTVTPNTTPESNPTSPTTACTRSKRSASPSSPLRASGGAQISHPPRPVSNAPSALSVQWTMTPKERLGLGGKMTKRQSRLEVLPWEAMEPHASSDDVKSMPPRKSSAASVPEVVQETRSKLKLKRLSLMGRR